MGTLLDYKCPACGGALQFDSDLQKMKCPYCDTEFEVEALQAQDSVLDTQPEDDMTWSLEEGQTWTDEEGLRSYVCNSCGGQIIGDESLAATKCPYCDNPVVMSGQFAGDLRPDLVIPFKFDKEAAMEALAKHTSGKVLLPKVFKSENRLQEIKGLYVPFWLFDAQVDADIRYRATKVRTWSDTDYNYTETKHYSIHRSGDLGFQAVPVDGSSKMPNELMESVEPYDLSQAEDFQTAYLAGYLADKYDVSAADSAPRANERIRSSTEQEFRSTVIGYSSVNQEAAGIRLKETAYKYALFPVWLLTTAYRDQKYTFAMNGQTGKMVGDLPVNWVAFWLWLVGVAAAVATAGYLLFSELVISIVSGVVIGLVVVFVMKGQLDTVHPAGGAGDYVIPGSLDLRISNDVYLYRRVTKVARPKDKK